MLVQIQMEMIAWSWLYYDSTLWGDADELCVDVAV